MEAAWRDLSITVQIATKLNRSHLVHGKTAYLLPCRGRIEIDEQATGPQSVTMEDSTGCMHGSRGVVQPASPHLRSEPAILAALGHRLAKFKAPKQIVIVESLPRNAMGKVQKAALRETYKGIYRSR